MWLIPRVVHGAEETLRVRTLQSFVSGLLTVIGYAVAVAVVIILTILLAIVFGLLTLGALAAIEAIAGILLLFALTFAFIVTAAFLADVLVGLAIGRWIVPALGVRVSTDRWSELGLLAVGAAVVVVLSALPIIGWLFKLAVVLGGLGALVLLAWNMWRARSGPGAPVTWPTAPGVAPPAPPPSAPPAAPAG